MKTITIFVAFYCMALFSIGQNVIQKIEIMLWRI